MTGTRSADATSMPTAVIIPFNRSSAIENLRKPPPAFTRAWADRHLPLVEAALVLLEADDADFADRCLQIEDAEGHEQLASLMSRIDQLGTHLADVADALSLTAERIKDVVGDRVPPRAEHDFVPNDICGLGVGKTEFLTGSEVRP